MDDVYEELVGSNINTTLIIKGKRTKRLRPPSPSGGGTVTSCSSSGVRDSGSGGGGGKDVSTYSLEDEDMANCLILLAQGGCIKQKEKYLYKCKTCNRTFQSFQALGGHMTSHKRSKIMGEYKKPIFTSSQYHQNKEEEEDEEEEFSNEMNFHVHLAKAKSSTTTQHLSLISTKIHECSICGTEFSSGQALGGHMRRHRNISTNGKVTINDERSFFPLDLNLPAPPSPPEDDHHRELKFQFGGNQQLLVFSAPALVDCHY